MLENVYIVYKTTKNTLKKFGPRTWCTKKPFGYRVIHQNSLMSCSGHTINFIYFKVDLNYLNLIFRCFRVFRYVILNIFYLSFCS